MILDPMQLNFQDTTNNLVPQDGPKGVPILLDFSGSQTEYDLDMTIPQQQGRVTQIQTVYIDASLSTAGMSVVVSDTNQKVTVKGKTQGYYPIAVPNPPKFRFFGTASDAIIPIILFNVPIAGVNWSSS
jgi:hypothetical protein